jgi:hypothetical protein
MKTNLRKLVALVIGLLLVVPVAADEPFEAKSTDLTAEDLAASLDMTWWKRHVTFEKPVKGWKVSLYELKRDGADRWERALLGSGGEFSSRVQTYKDLTVTVILRQGDKGPEVMIRTPSSRSVRRIARMPDLSISGTPDPAPMVDGCLVLAARYKNDVITPNVADMIFVVGLEIKTE